MKDIMLKITGRQISAKEAEDEQKMEFVTEGRYYEKDDAVYLLYEESEFSGMEGCTTSLKISGDKVRMKRYGDSISLDMAIDFEKGKRFKGFYDTPFGAIEMEVLTNDVVNRIQREDGKGSLDIDYHICLRGLSEGRSVLNIEIM